MNHYEHSALVRFAGELLATAPPGETKRALDAACGLHLACIKRPDIENLLRALHARGGDSDAWRLFAIRLLTSGPV